MTGRLLALMVVAMLVPACGTDTPAEDGGATSDSGMRSDAALDGALPTTDGSVPVVDGSVDDASVAMDGSIPELDSSTPTDDGAVGADASADTCMRNRECAGDTFCLHPTGSCDAPGTCVAVPTTEDCTGMTIDPVCGCDGNTYGAACIAEMSRVSVDTVGACPAPVVCPDTPPVSCCYQASDCGGGGGGGGFGMRCAGADCAADPAVAGVCKGRPGSPGACWVDGDCRLSGPGATCVGATICPCGGLCEVPDSPGTCTVPG